MLRFRVLGASFSRFWGLRFRDRVLRFRDRVLRFRDLGASFSNFGCFVFKIWVLRFRVLGASFSSFGCFVLRSSFSSASFSKRRKEKNWRNLEPLFSCNKKLYASKEVRENALASEGKSCRPETITTICVMTSQCETCG